jgi:virulence-associated protein VapD
MQQRANDDDASRAAAEATAKQSLKKLETIFNDLDEVLLGLNLDKTRGSLYLDCQVTAVPGSETAGTFAELKQAASDFAGFALPDAAVTLNEVRSLSDADLAQVKPMLANFRTRAAKKLDESGDLTKDQAELAKKLVADALDVAEKTLEGKKIDLGAALLLKPGATAVVAGCRVADGNKLDQVVRKLVAEIGKDEPDFAKSVKLDAETADGVHFHTVTIPVGSEAAVPALGEKIDVVLGISDEKLYVAAGRDALKLLKEAITKSKSAAGKEVPPMQLSIAATPIAKFIAEVGPAKMFATTAVGILEKSAGKDHLTITMLPVANGVSTRLELEDGVLKMVNFYGQSMMGGAPGGAGGMGPGGMPEQETPPHKRPEKKPPPNNGPSPF